MWGTVRIAHGTCERTRAKVPLCGRCPIYVASVATYVVVLVVLYSTPHRDTAESIRFDGQLEVAIC